MMWQIYVIFRKLNIYLPVKFILPYNSWIHSMLREKEGLPRKAALSMLAVEILTQLLACCAFSENLDLLHNFNRKGVSNTLVEHPLASYAVSGAYSMQRQIRLRSP